MAQQHHSPRASHFIDNDEPSSHHQRERRPSPNYTRGEQQNSRRLTPEQSLDQHHPQHRQPFHNGYRQGGRDEFFEKRRLDRENAPVIGLWPKSPTHAYGAEKKKKRRNLAGRKSVMRRKTRRSTDPPPRHPSQSTSDPMIFQPTTQRTVIAHHIRDTSHLDVRRGRRKSTIQIARKVGQVVVTSRSMIGSLEKGKANLNPSNWKSSRMRRMYGLKGRWLQSLRSHRR